MEKKSKNNLKTKKYVPGSIFVRGNMLWIKYKGSAFSSGFHDSPKGRIQANERLEKLHIDTLKNDGSLPSEKSTTEKILVSDAINEYIEYRQRRGYKEGPISRTRGNLTKHLTQNIKLSIKSIENDIKIIVMANYQAQTKNQYITEIKTFIKWCQENEFIGENEKIKINYYTTVKDKEPEVFSKNEYKALYEETKKISPDLACALEIMWNTGMRKMEALSLRINQIDLKKRTITLFNKIDGNPELVPIPMVIMGTLEKAIKNAKNRETNNGELFELTTGRSSHIFLTAFKKAGIVKRSRLFFHSLRKSYATRLIESEIPITAVQKLMRHKDINMTLKLYAKVNAEKLIEYADIATQK